tara:strand:- start:461 stop:1051 length:591 start_codon:yes stop_codon:yes gene_type:complete
MIRIGIIGEIGSGKSYIAKQFGFPVFNADKEVYRIYKQNKICYKKLKNKFSKHIISFPVKKKELIKIINKNIKNVKKINKIVHPFVRANLNKFLIKNKKKKAVVLDVPLLLEGKINKKNDILIFVSSKKKDINKRIKKKLNFNIKIYKILKKLQLPLETKKKKANFVIKNNFRSVYIKKNVKVIKNIILNNERSST